MTFGELCSTLSLAEGAPEAVPHTDRLKVLLPFWGETAIGRITKNLAREYRQSRHREKQLTDTTINRDLECLRRMFVLGRGRRTSAHESVEPHATRTGNGSGKRPGAQPDGGGTLLLAAAAPHLRSLIIAALDAGMRRGELLTERWEGRGTLPVDCSLQVTARPLKVKNREIPLTSRLFNLLWDMREDEGLIFYL